MPEITVTESQLAALEDIADYLEREHVGPYGHVRSRDVVQFLIDRYEDSDTVDRDVLRRAVADHLDEYTYQELQAVAADTDGVEPAGKEADLRERLVDARIDELLTTGDESTQESGATPSDDSTDEAETTDEESAADESDDDAGGSRLERMMGLLDRYEDAWDETDTEDGKYAVTLPDGTTETVRTKDDVRALLFQHYE